MCGLEPGHAKPPVFREIDHYWRMVHEIHEAIGKLKYPHLLAFVKCILSLSHSKIVPERGFSVNKILLDSHGFNLRGHDNPIKTVTLI